MDMDKHMQCFAGNLASGCAASPSSSYWISPGLMGVEEEQSGGGGGGGGGEIGTQWELKGLGDCLVKICLVAASEAYTRASMSPHWASSFTGLPTLAHAP